ncbi:MAG: hypothetical protein ACHQQQ_05940 [Bacteroidota bacterium]
MKKSILVLGLAILLAIPVLSFAGNVTNMKFPISGTLLDPCTGELIDYTGEVHAVINTSTNPDGTIRTVISEFAHVTGVGETSGASYVANENLHDKIVNSGCPYTETSTDFLRLIGKGQVGNEHLQIVQTLTVDASCNPTFNATLTIICK